MSGQTQSNWNRPRGTTEEQQTNGHVLVQVTEQLPGDRPTDSVIDLSEGDSYKARYYRCRHCGQERNQPSDFRERCEAYEAESLIGDGGYSIDDPRTRRALTEQMGVRFGRRGPNYEIDSESGNTYLVNIAESTCTCPDFVKRRDDLGNLGCKHLRRVELSIRARVVPGPDGTFD